VNGERGKLPNRRGISRNLALFGCAEFKTIRIIKFSLAMSIRATVVFVRHGETQENRDKIIQGQMDSHLNELGRRQADAVAEALRDVPFTHALSSDLSRAKDVGTFQTLEPLTHPCAVDRRGHSQVS
jgi:hypothetical protein